VRVQDRLSSIAIFTLSPEESMTFLISEAAYVIKFLEKDFIDQKSHLIPKILENPDGILQKNHGLLNLLQMINAICMPWFS